jgi:uncharacterized protein YfkK (UPF0435 family)
MRPEAAAGGPAGTGRRFFDSLTRAAGEGSAAIRAPGGALESRTLRTRAACRCPKLTSLQGETAEMIRLTLALLAFAASGAAHATCIYPRAPATVPDGATATFEEMAAAQKAVRQFNEDINAYNACLDLEMTTFEKSGQYDENRLTELRAMQAKKNNAAVDEVQAIADRFNEQLRIFKARDKQN